ncbi:MAG: tetratricopeptide repeat protein [Leptolyngbya sp. SIO1E4]|nr:tetratricopeptide repeat protein [Leptolyngbya sp. SIO1E4]
MQQRDKVWAGLMALVMLSMGVPEKARAVSNSPIRGEPSLSPFWLIMPGLSASTGVERSLVASTNDRRAEADQWLQQGIEHSRRSQLQAAQTSFEAALARYRELGDRPSEVTALIHLADTHTALGQYRQALALLEQALAIAQEIQDPNYEANALNGLSWVHVLLNDAHLSRTYAEQALRLHQQLQDVGGEAQALNHLGLAYYSLNDYSKATAYYQQALPRFRQVEDPSGEGNVLMNQGVAYFALNDYWQAITYYEQALSRVRQAGDRQGEANVFTNLGNVYSALNNYQQAIAYYEQALPLFQDMGNRQGEANVLMNLGLVAWSLSNYREAIAYYEQALPLFQQIENSEREANTFMSLGNAYGALSDYQAAIVHYEQALPLFQQMADLSGQANTLNNLGVAYTALSDYRLAIAYLEQAQPLFQQVEDPQGTANALANLGNAYNRLSDYPSAIADYDQALRLFRQIEDRQGAANALNNLGLVYQSLGSHQDAIVYYEDALSLFQQIENRDGEALVLGNLGLLYWLLEDYSQALSYLEQSLALYQAIENPNGEARVFAALGIGYLARGEYDQAVSYLEQSLPLFQSVGDVLGHAHTLTYLGKTYTALNDYDRASAYYEQALPLFQQIENRAGEGFLLSSLGELFARQDQTELAITFYKSSVNVRESIRGDLQRLSQDLQQTYTASIATDYRALADLLLQQDRIMEAQRVLDLLKVQELDEYLRGVQRTGATQEGIDYLRPEATILAQYDDLQQSAVAAGQELADLKAIAEAERTAAQTQRIAALTALLDDINRDFRNFARSPEVQALVDQLSYDAQEASLSLNQLDRLRDELKQLNAVIFYPLILEDRIELVITTPDSPPLRRTVPVPRAELNRTILAFRDALTTADPAIEDPAQQLYDWLIRPLEADLAEAGVETIIYSPDGQLRYIPLAALHDGEDWLIQRYQVNNITAASLTDLTETDVANPRILAGAYADETLVHTAEVNGKTYTFQGLPGAGLEIDSLPTDMKLLDEAFSLDAVRPIMDEYTVLHFATHAAFVPGVPEDSFILFGNGDTPTLRDVAGWSLNGVDLVVLSACETGVGGLGNGEEILGLGYQFQLSGAKAVMSSLWQVSDQGTQMLMTAFYDALGQGMTKAAALQAAQIAVMTGDLDSAVEGDERSAIQPILREGAGAIDVDDYSHPYYWASFILIGNGQ